MFGLGDAQFLFYESLIDFEVMIIENGRYVVNYIWYCQVSEKSCNLKKKKKLD